MSSFDSFAKLSLCFTLACTNYNIDVPEVSDAHTYDGHDDWTGNLDTTSAQSPALSAVQRLTTDFLRIDQRLDATEVSTLLTFTKKY